MGLRYFKEAIPDALRRPLKLTQRMLRENHYVDSLDKQLPQSKSRFGKFAIFATTNDRGININVKSLHSDLSLLLFPRSPRRGQPIFKLNHFSFFSFPIAKKLAPVRFVFDSDLKFFHPLFQSPPEVDLYIPKI